MEVDTVSKKNAREKTIARLYELLERKRSKSGLV